MIKKKKIFYICIGRQTPLAVIFTENILLGVITINLPFLHQQCCEKIS